MPAHPGGTNLPISHSPILTCILRSLDKKALELLSHDGTMRRMSFMEQQQPHKVLRCTEYGVDDLQSMGELWTRIRPIMSTRGVTQCPSCFAISPKETSSCASEVAAATVTGQHDVRVSTRLQHLWCLGGSPTFARLFTGRKLCVASELVATRFGRGSRKGQSFYAKRWKDGSDDHDQLRRGLSHRNLSKQEEAVERILRPLAWC